MFVIVADIKLKEGVESEFKKWFSEANTILTNFDGFISRRLLQAQDGNYRIIVEHQSKETFSKMHQSPEHDKLHKEADSFFAAEPIRKIYTIVAD